MADLSPPRLPTADAPRPPHGGRKPDTPALGCPRYLFPGCSHVYAVISSRARGLSVGVNLNLDRACDFDCCYCEVQREQNGPPPTPAPVNAHTVATELTGALVRVRDGKLPGQPHFESLPPGMNRLAHVAISGDGEPTLCPNFAEAVEGIIHLRAAGLTPYFKLVLLTNGTRLDQASVRSGLKLFTRADEIWVKLDAGSQETMDRINRASVPLATVLSNIQALARIRPVVIQSMFVELDGQLPDRREIGEYAQRLVELKAAGAQIGLVQIYSANRPHHSRRCRHLSLRVLSDIATQVHEHTKLAVEVF